MISGHRQDALDGRPAYVLSVTSEAQNKYLIDGKIAVDATDYSIVRIEGVRTEPFLLGPAAFISFTHTKRLVPSGWRPRLTPMSEIRIFGAAN